MRYLYQESHNRLFIWSEEFGKRSDMREATQGEIERLLTPNGWKDKEESLGDEVDLVITAKRELIEEIGYGAGKLTLLGEIDPCVGYSDEHMWICLAEDLVMAQNNLDQDEFIELLPVTRAEALVMATNGQITDVKTIIGIMWADRYLG